MGHPGARGGGPCPGEHRPQSQCTVMGWDMFPIAFASQNSYPMSHSSCNSNILARFRPICFPGRGPFAQGGCRGLARGAGHERSLLVEGRALQRLQGGSPHICCMDGLEKQMYRLLGCRMFQRVSRFIGSSFPPGLRPQHESGGAGGEHLPAMPDALQAEEETHHDRTPLLDGCPALGQPHEGSWGP